MMATPSYRQACALIRHRVRRRLDSFKSQDIWNTSFFIDRVDLAIESFSFRMALMPNGSPSTLENLVDVVREEFRDFVLVEDTQEQFELRSSSKKITCNECSHEYEISDSLYCPWCKYPNLFYTARNELSNLLEYLSPRENDPIGRRVLASTLDWRTEDTYQKTVTCFESFFKKTRLFAASKAGHDPMPIARKTLFQNLSETHAWFQSNYRLDIFESIPQEDVHLLQVVFQKRHVLAHNGGIMDINYVRNIDGLTDDIGRPVHKTKTEIVDAIKVVRQIIQITEKSLLPSEK